MSREAAGLPRGWHAPSQEQKRGHELELQREIPVGHQLHGLAVEVVAVCNVCDEDLVRNSDGWRRVHLTWSGKTEPVPDYPLVGPASESWEDVVADAELHARDHGSYSEPFVEWQGP